MVRRRKLRDATSVPQWVAIFSPDDWEGADIFGQWRAWQAAVRTYCATEKLWLRDFPTWLDVTRSGYAVGRQLRQEIDLSVRADTVRATSERSTSE